MSYALKVRRFAILPMSEIRVNLLSSLICLILIVCLMVRIETALRSPEVLSYREDAGIEQLETRMRELDAQFELLRVEIAKPETVRLDVTPATPAVAKQLEALERGLQEVLFELQGLASSTTDGISHSLADIRRSFPVTNWAACEALMLSATSEPGAAGRSYFDADKSKTLNGLLMTRPHDILGRFGSPSKTQIISKLFVWCYESPSIGDDGLPDRCLTITFDRGYVWDVEFTQP